MTTQEKAQFILEHDGCLGIACRSEGDPCPLWDLECVTVASGRGPEHWPEAVTRALHAAARGPEPASGGPQSASVGPQAAPRGPRYASTGPEPTEAECDLVDRWYAKGNCNSAWAKCCLADMIAEYRSSLVAEYRSSLVAAPEMHKVCRDVAKQPKRALVIMEREGIVFGDLEDKWQKMALTLYTLLVQSAMQAEEVIAEVEGAKE